MDQDEKKVREGYFMTIFHTLISENLMIGKKRRDRERKKDEKTNKQNKK